MNSMPPHLDSAAEEQAALWAARLDGSVLSSADQTALEAWLALNPAHRDALLHYCQFSDELAQAIPTLVRAGAVERPAHAPRARRGWTLFFATTSALAAAAVIAVVVWSNHTAREFKDVATAIAQRQSITLADGTRIDLNARTTLHVDLGQVERHVRLSNGEAFFAVSKDKSRPFTVDTPAGSVRVTGTAFNVRMVNAPALEVTVLEGSVQVRPNQSSEPVLLGAGQKLTTGADGVSVQALTDSDLSDVLAWRKGQIVFDGVPLREALARFAEYHGITLTVSPAAAEKRLGGRYSLDDINGFFAGIQEPLGVRVTRNREGTVNVQLQAEH